MTPDVKAVVRYLEARRLAGGRVAYYYCPPAAAVEARVVSRCPLGDDLADAVKKAETYNKHLDAWRRGEEQRAAVLVGSIDHLIGQFQRSRAYPQKPKTAAHYDYALKVLAETKGGDGRRFGALPVAKISPAHVMRLWDVLLAGRAAGTGERRAGAAIAIARRAWEWGRKAGLAPQDNPWSRPGIKSSPHAGVVWSREEFRRFTAQARAMGKTSVALAALMTRDLCQRPGDVCAMRWSNWDSEGGVFRFKQSKTGVDLTVPPSADLAEVLGKMTPGAPEDLIIRTEDRGVAITESRLPHLVAEVRDAAGLPRHLIAKDWRHTGLTEAGEAGASIAELQALSGHRTVQILARYVRASSAAAASAVAKRDAARAKAARRALPAPPKALPAPEA